MLIFSPLWLGSLSNWRWVGGQWDTNRYYKDCWKMGAMAARRSQRIWYVSNNYFMGLLIWCLVGGDDCEVDNDMLTDELVSGSQRLLEFLQKSWTGLTFFFLIEFPSILLCSHSFAAHYLTRKKHLQTRAVTSPRLLLYPSLAPLTSYPVACLSLQLAFILLVSWCWQAQHIQAALSHGVE